MADYQKAGEVLQIFLGAHAKQLEGAKLAREWESLVGPVLSRETAVDRLEKSVLHISVGDPAWLGELALARPTLLEKIQKAAPRAGVAELRFYLNPRFAKEEGRMRSVPPPPPKFPEPPEAGSNSGSPLKQSLARLKFTMEQVSIWRNTLPDEDPWTVPPPPVSRMPLDETPLFFPPGGVSSSFLDLDGHR